MNLQNKLSNVGFSFKKLNDQSILITGIPQECKEYNLKFIIEHLIEQHKNNDNLQTEQNKQLAISLANSMTIQQFGIPKHLGWLW